jgi:hypothetical protein
VAGVPPIQLPEILLPKMGRQEKAFATEMGRAIAPSEALFQRNDKIVEVKDEAFTKELDNNKLASGGLKFSVLSPTRARTWVEDYVTTGFEIQSKNKGGKLIGDRSFMPLSMANTLMVSPQFVRQIPVINRILDVIIPIKKPDGRIITPLSGFNCKLGIYCKELYSKVVDEEIKKGASFQ